MQKFIIDDEALYDLLKDGNGKCYDSNKYSELKIEVADERVILEPNDEDSFYIIHLTKIDVMQLVRRGIIEFEHDYSDYLIKVEEQK